VITLTTIVIVMVIVTAVADRATTRRNKQAPSVRTAAPPA
jgi:hypothetical protein